MRDVATLLQRLATLGDSPLIEIRRMPIGPQFQVTVFRARGSRQYDGGSLGEALDRAEAYEAYSVADAGPLP